MLELYLLRHGKAAKPEGYEEDFDRPLNKKGVIQINQIGYRLQSQGIQMNQIISSAAIRTKETTQIANYYLGALDVTYDQDLYLAKQTLILAGIKKYAKEKKIFYVGHNFGISELASSLSENHYSMSTGMYIHLQFELDDWQAVSAGTGIVKEVYAPNIYLP